MRLLDKSYNDQPVSNKPTVEQFLKAVDFILCKRLWVMLIGFMRKQIMAKIYWKN